MHRVKIGFVVLATIVLVSASIQAAEVTPAAGLNARDFAPAKPVTSETPPAPDPDVIRQGGDTCAAATAIPSLPFSSSGTTTGYTDDYDEACTYTGSTSPDVVYAFTPATNTAIDVTLCANPSAYDTKLYIYEDTCPTTYTACNDDSCASPGYPNAFQSSLSGVSVRAGHTYYIVVDGYGGENGNYSIDVSEFVPPIPCPAGSLYGQPVFDPDDDWNAATSGNPSWADYSVHDSFDASLMSITDLQWWGISGYHDGSSWNVCDPTGMTFDVRFFDDNAGQPGMEICSYTGVAPTMTDTGLLYSGFSLYSWQLSGMTPACEPTGMTWVSVTSLANANDCAMLWMNGYLGDSSCLQWDANASTYTAQPYDASLCVGGTMYPVELQSFDVR